jgi:hypothetical protein
MPEDFDVEKTGVVYLRESGGSLIDALSQSDSQIVRVNLFRESVSEGDVEYPSVTADGQKSNVWFLISSSGERKRPTVIAGEYHYFPVDWGNYETYPVKSASEAYSELTSGGGYISNLGGAVLGRVKIRKVYLGYYDPDVLGQYFQPVYVFEGDGGFRAYVAAVAGEYYGEGGQ